MTLKDAFAIYENQSVEKYSEFINNKTNTFCEPDSTNLDNSMPYLFDPNELIDIAKKYIGTPYRYGGVSVKGFDCSGFMGYIFGCIGFSLPRRSVDIAKIGKSVDLKEVRVGDLMFFKSRASSKTHHIGHVGLVVENECGEIRVIHASLHHGVIIEKFNTSAYFKKNYITSRRILPAS